MQKKKKKNLDPYFTPCIKIHSRWKIAINFRAKIINLLDENIEKNCELELGRILATTRKAWSIKEKNHKLDLVKLIFLSQKRPLRKLKDKAGRKYLQIRYLRKDSYPDIYSYKLVIRKPILKMGKILHLYFTKRIYE